ncbi:unnamed protein product [Caenorhabditis sp. 36 PRJEB53466]|nr:unnamed protein product [Caenorhabditis sp. 36 PRJEB53466]
MRQPAVLVVAALVLLVSIASTAPYQTYRTYRSPMRDGTFDHASMFRFTGDGGSSATAGGGNINQPRFGYGFRDYPYAQIQYGAASSPLYVFDGRLYNLASARS